MRFMATKAKKTSRARSSAKAGRTFVYRGIMIPPVIGKRSPTAQAIREALQAMLESERARGKSTDV
jgi:hypothetical protein